MGFDYRTSTGLRHRHLEDTNKTLCAPGSRRKEQWPHKRQYQTFLSGSRSLWWRHGLAVVCSRVGDTGHGSAYTGHFEGDTHYLHCLHHSVGSGQTPEWEHLPINRKLGKKEKKKNSEAAISLLSLYIRGQTEWKWQPQKTNQTYHMDHSLV